MRTKYTEEKVPEKHEYVRETRQRTFRENAGKQRIFVIGVLELPQASFIFEVNRITSG